MSGVGLLQEARPAYNPGGPAGGTTPSGPAGGDLTGSYPNPLISGTNSITNAVIVKHANGSITAYAPSANTNVARGNALLAAVTAAVAGDVIYLSSNTFDIGSSNVVLPNNVSLFGSGMYSTTITSVADLNGPGPIVVPGTNTTVGHMSIIGSLSDGATFQAGFGIFNASLDPPVTVPSNCVGVSLYVACDSDAVYLEDDSGITSSVKIRIYDSILSGKWDSFFAEGWASDSLIELYNTCCISRGGSSFTGQGSHGLYTAGYIGTLRVFGGALSSGSGNAFNIGLGGQSNGTALQEFYGVDIFASGTVPNSIKLVSSIMIANGCNFDPATVSIGLNSAINSAVNASSLFLGSPNTQTGATYTVKSTDTSIIANHAGTVTLTLGTAVKGRVLIIRTITANTVVSASSNVVPSAGGSAGTAILAATAGKWAMLQGDGTSWQVMMAN